MTTPVARPLIADSALDLIGATPMVRLKRVVPQDAATVIGKMESLNPGGSVKDRIALAMIEDAERNGRLKPDSVIVEPTSGNTGIGLALVAAVKGYRIILTMPDDMSVERRRLLERYGAVVPTWDIVNEPIAPWDKLPGNLRNGAFYAALGADYIANSYRLARKVAPEARLYLNEAQTESADDNGEVFRKSLLELLKRLKGEGVPIDGVGFESHLDSKRPYDFPRFAAFVEEIAAMGFEIAISELDINDHAWPADPNTRDRLVAGMYRNFLSAVLPVKAVKRLTLWQIADHTSWMYYDDVANNPKAVRRPRPLPFDSAFKKKPAWDAIAEALDAMPAR